LYFTGDVTNDYTGIVVLVALPGGSLLSFSAQIYGSELAFLTGIIL